MNPFGRAKKNQNATAAPAAMKGIAKARTVIAAPVKAEERLLKVCVRRTPLERAWRIRILDKPSCAALDRALALILFQNKNYSPVRSRLWMNVHKPH